MHIVQKKTTPALRSIVIVLVLLLILATPAFAGGNKEKAEENQGKTEQAVEASQQENQNGDQARTAENSNKKRSTLAVASGGAVASVNGEVITEDAFNAQIENLRKSYRAQRGSDIPAQELDKLKKQVVQAMITKNVLLQNFRELGFSVDPDRVDREIQNVKNNYGSDAEFEKSMADQGYDMERLRKEITQSLQVFMVQQHVVEDVEVTDEEMRRAYNSNVDQIAQPETVRARHILVSLEEGATEEDKAAAREKIEAIQDELAAGADFAELAKEKSEGPSSKNGGDLGYFSADKMVPSFSDAAFALQPGEVSGIVETRFGYHIIKLEDRKDAWLPSFEEVKEHLRPQLEQQKAQMVFQEYVQQLQGKAEIEILRPDLKPEQQ
ncbi:peptidylprolyl isomerase [Marispirochaeta aestuarii]|uniref:foldase protein PrsA n=1 Tax=Marispirochaeta aestuarii TaxID=1963862 RepID=UPI0029C93FC2|nr:peptidylprolyl isomerase [Marispirochaeta aestuarii]